MSDAASIRPLLAVLIPAAGAVLILLSGRNPNKREAWTVGASVLMFVVIASLIPEVLSGNRIVFRLAAVVPGLSLALAVDAMGLAFAVTASFLWILTSIYSIGYVRSLVEHAQTRYFACFAAALSATVGLAFSANLFTMFVFYEIITFATYPLVSHHEDAEARAGGAKYLTYLVGASKLFLLAAMAITWNLAGTLDFSRGGILGGAASNKLLVLTFLLFLFGFAKAAVMPLHSWLPSAMVAPTPVSALLHAVAVVKAGVFSLLRVILHIFGPVTMKESGADRWALVFAGLTIIIASLIALAKDNLKARLAYSTVSQLAYIILGAALVTQSGITGGVLHVTNHAFGKITLFFCAGAIFVASGKTEISQLAGIGRRMPWTMAAFTVGALSLIGVPPAAGFASKWFLALGSAAHASGWPLAVLMASTLLNAAYFLPIIYMAWFEPYPGDASGTAPPAEAPRLMLAPLLLTAAGAVILGLWPGFFLSLARCAAP